MCWKYEEQGVRKAAVRSGNWKAVQPGTGDLIELYNLAVDSEEQHNLAEEKWDTAYRRPGNRNADDQCCGQTYVELYQIDARPERIEKIKI